MSAAISKLVADLSQELADAVQAKKKIDRMVASITETEAAIDSVAGSVEGHPGAAALVEFHKIKLPGKYGSYGTSDKKAKLSSMSETLANDITFLGLSIGVYNAVSKGMPIPAFTPADIPGYDAAWMPPYNKDKDHPMSVEKLESGPDFHFQNRPYIHEKIIDRRKFPDCIWPTIGAIGDAILCDGILYIQESDEEDGFRTFQAAGLQEPDDACYKFGTPGVQVVGLVHTPCVALYEVAPAVEE